MAGITEALEPIQISAMDQRQNTSDIFDAKSGPGQSLVNTRRSLRFRSRAELHSDRFACNATSAYCTECQKYQARSRHISREITIENIHPKRKSIETISFRERHSLVNLTQVSVIRIVRSKYIDF